MQCIKEYKIHLLVLFITLVCELIGPFKYKLIVMFPMLYAMLLGGVIGLPKFKILSHKNMQYASSIVSMAILILLAKLGLGLGANLVLLKGAKSALLLQEIGHFFGTIILGMPIAVLLGMKKEAIGATYSVGREGNIAIIDQKYGLDSPEGHGVMSMYICGTLFGSLWLAIFVGMLAETGFFHPYALAMGAGVGSGSMMAASLGAILEVYPNYATGIQSYAVAANVLSSILGMWVGLFLSLPFAIKFYHLLSKIRDKFFSSGGAAKDTE